ncbi:hypothetical protein NEHOM01_1373 [Nematocida homosporus]|uniref:uncharacterized protein n=1 Tax=Nematocida homosporus TaxID=1912981 RepID=UPI00221FF924|nr:uncharacterized protein NEHOM01_1373 [Nematocida homosporus]KAI5186309.1 hypothetical protein NEHOM01_1373 [Nematocida homosporus]
MHPHIPRSNPSKPLNNPILAPNNPRLTPTNSIPTSTKRTKPLHSEEVEKVAIAKAILDIGEETNLDRKKKNRIAARKAREKKSQYLLDLQAHTWTLTHANRTLQVQVNRLTAALEHIIEEVDQAVTAKSIDIRRLLAILLNTEHLHLLSPKHRHILHKIRLSIISG